jgi:hypothetical protein
MGNILRPFIMKQNTDKCIAETLRRPVICEGRKKNFWNPNTLTILLKT